MAEGEKGSKVSLGTSHVSFVIADIINIIVIAILYGIGREKTCDDHVKKMVLAYLIIKAWMVLLRWACCWLLMLPNIIGVIINLGFTLFWILGMMAYYIAALVYFFSKDNDCLDNGTVVWVAMLLIVIEAFSMIIIMCILLCVLACMIPAVIIAVKSGS